MLKRFAQLQMKEGSFVPKSKPLEEMDRMRYRDTLKEVISDHSSIIRDLAMRYSRKPLTPNTTLLLLNQFLNLKDSRMRMSLTTSLLHHIRKENTWGNLIREPHFVNLINIGAQSGNILFVLHTIKWARSTGCLTPNIRSTINGYIRSLSLKDQASIKKQLLEMGVDV